MIRYGLELLGLVDLQPNATFTVSKDYAKDIYGLEIPHSLNLVGRNNADRELLDGKMKTVISAWLQLQRAELYYSSALKFLPKNIEDTSTVLDETRQIYKNVCAENEISIEYAETIFLTPNDVREDMVLKNPTTSDILGF